jgi:hypothetical protein
MLLWSQHSIVSQLSPFQLTGNDAMSVSVLCCVYRTLSTLLLVGSVNAMRLDSYEVKIIPSNMKTITSSPNELESLAGTLVTDTKFTVIIARRIILKIPCSF